MNVFKPHSLKQQELIFSDAQETIALTGTQYGKSLGGSLWKKVNIHKSKNPKANFLLGAPTYKIMKQSMLPYFLDVMRGCGKYNSSDAEFKLNQGGTVFLRTATDPDSIVGIPDIEAAWLDEAGKLGLYFWENFQARVAARGAKVLLTSSPYAMNWLYKRVKKVQTGEIPGVKLVQAASWENPYHTLHDPVKREEMRKTMDPRRFMALFGGEFGNKAGLVFDCFEESIHVIPSFALPAGTKIFAGIDWGFTEPFVICVRAVTPSGHHFSISTFYKSGLLVDQQIEKARQLKITWGIERFIAGGDRPENIAAFNQAGLTCVAADMSKGAVLRGVDLHYQLIKSGHYKVFEGSPHLIDEYASYHYPEPEDLGPDDDSKEQNPVGQNDHAMSAERYVTVATWQRHEKLTPKTPDVIIDATKVDHEKRIQLRKKRQGHFPGSERFS